MGKAGHEQMLTRQWRPGVELMVAVRQLIVLASTEVTWLQRCGRSVWQMVYDSVLLRVVHSIAVVARDVVDKPVCV